MSTTKTNDDVDHEADDGYCTEYTTDHGVDVGVRPDNFYFAFICPKCEEKNPLKGDPRDFQNLPYRCMHCDWVSLLVDDAIREFAEQHAGEIAER